MCWFDFFFSRILFLFDLIVFEKIEAKIEIDSLRNVGCVFHSPTRWNLLLFIDAPLICILVCHRSVVDRSHHRDVWFDSLRYATWWKISICITFVTCIQKKLQSNDMNPHKKEIRKHLHNINQASSSNWRYFENDCFNGIDCFSFIGIKDERRTAFGRWKRLHEIKTNS